MRRAQLVGSLGLVLVSLFAGCSAIVADTQLPTCSSDAECNAAYHYADPLANPTGCARWACVEGYCAFDEAERADCLDNDCDGVVDEGALAATEEQAIGLTDAVPASFHVGPELSLLSADSGALAITGFSAAGSEGVEIEIRNDGDVGCLVSPVYVGQIAPQFVGCRPRQAVGGGAADALVGFIDSEGVPRAGRLRAGTEDLWIELPTAASTTNGGLGFALTSAIGGEAGVDLETCAREDVSCRIESLSLDQFTTLTSGDLRYGALTVVADEGGLTRAGVLGLVGDATRLYAADEGAALPLGLVGDTRTVTVAEPDGSGFLGLSITESPWAVQLARVPRLEFPYEAALTVSGVYTSDVLCAEPPALFADSYSCGSALGVCGPGTFACVDGAEICLGARAFGLDADANGAIAELCDNGVDDDCDGHVDEPADCQSCSETAELCNGIDDDCDGLVDETFPEEGVACGGEEVCAPGTYACHGGALVCAGAVRRLLNSLGLPYDAPTPTGGTPSDEDCDGTVDESSPSCVPQNEDANCNGFDDDCDGSVDEGYAPGASTLDLPLATQRVCVGVEPLAEPVVDAITSASATVHKSGLAAVVDLGEDGEYRRLGVAWVESGAPGSRAVFLRVPIARCTRDDCTTMERVEVDPAALAEEDAVELNTGAGDVDVLDVAYVDQGFSVDGAGEPHGGFFILYRVDGGLWLARVDGLSGELLDDGCATTGGRACGTLLDTDFRSDEQAELVVREGVARWGALRQLATTASVTGGAVQRGCE